MFDDEIEAAREAKYRRQLEEVKKIADEIIGYMGLSDKLTTEIVDDECCDPDLRIGNCGCTVLATQIRVDDNRIGSFGAKIDVDGFVIGHMVLIPGVRHYKDGSGEPDDCDFTEVEQTQVVIDAAVRGIRHALNLLLDSGTEAYGENQMFKDFEQYADDS